MQDNVRDWLLDHHKATYQSQLERCEKIRERVSFLSGQLTLLGGALAYVGTSYPHSWAEGRSLWFYIPVGLALILFSLAVFRVLYALGWGFRYSLIPAPDKLQDYAEKVDEFTAASPEDKVDALADIKERMAQAYCVAATYNVGVNARRSNLLLRATQIGIISFVLLLLALPGYFLASPNRHPEPTRVLVTQPIRIQP